MAKTIQRSSGVAVGGYIVGGGYEGKTQELDNRVKQAAEFMSETYNRDIEIRFNSDRVSGGAFLVNSLKGFDGNCQVGLCAGIANVRVSVLLGIPEGNVYLATNARASVLVNPSLAKDGLDGGKYSYVYHRTIEDAQNWLIANVDTDKILA